VQRQILRLIREMQEAHDTAVLFITHDLGVVAKICDTVTVLFAGQVLESAETRVLFDNPTNAYTRALFAATPRWDRPDQSLVPVPDAITDALWASAHASDARR